MNQEQLEQDYHIARQRFESLRLKKEPNRMVVRADYLRPSIYGSELPPEDPSGLYSYFKDLTEILREALECGEIAATKNKTENINLPEYLTKLIKE